MRGYRLESLGLLVAQSSRPRPWRHLSSLKELSSQLDQLWESSHTQYSEPERDWAPLKQWYTRRMFRRLSEESKQVNWEQEFSTDSSHHPALHLPHLLRILGPSSLTLYKHVLARRRILIYTNPVVEPACILAHIASDLCGQEDRINVLGIVGINAMDKITEETRKGHGWIACTTDAIFLEKPSLYDLVIDMTASQPSRPGFFMSRPITGSPRGSRYRLVAVRFTFSDVRLWSELDRILRLDAQEVGEPMESRTSWTDGWRLYDDICVACAGAWMGSWKAGNSSWGIGRSGTLRVNSGGIRLDGDDGIRRLGQGIEGRPTMKGEDTMASSSSSQTLSREARTTLALLKIFHAHSEFLSERLSELVEEASVDSESSATLVLTPRDVTALELGVFSELDAKFLEWLAERNEKASGKKVVVKRGWRDLLGALLSFA